MEIVYSEIELINAGDLEAAKHRYIKSDDIRKIKVNALVDSGAYILVISEDVRLQLGLDIIDHRVTEYANGEIEEVPVASPIEIRFANRRTVTDAMVIGKQVLLGAIPMEAMDVIINPRLQN